MGIVKEGEKILPSSALQKLNDLNTRWQDANYEEFDNNLYRDEELANLAVN